MGASLLNLLTTIKVHFGTTTSFPGWQNNNHRYPDPIFQKTRLTVIKLTFIYKSKY